MRRQLCGICTLRGSPTWQKEGVGACLGCLRKGPTDEVDSVRAMKGWARGLSLTSLHASDTDHFRPRTAAAGNCLNLWSLPAIAAGHSWEKDVLLKACDAAQHQTFCHVGRCQ